MNRLGSIRWRVIALALLGVAPACGAKAAEQSDIVASLQHIARTGRGLPLTVSPEERGRLERLYQASGYSLMWLNPSGKPRRVGTDALERVRGAATEGLRPADYGVGRIDSLIRLAGERSQDAALVARADAGISAALLRFLDHLHVGRVSPRRAGFSIDRPRERHDYVELLLDGWRRSDIAGVVEGLAPELTQYRLARQALARWRARSDSAEPPLRLPVPLEPNRPADPEQLRNLARRLQRTGDLARIPPNPARYEGELVAAVQRLQGRMGLPSEGVIGAETLGELNTSSATRVRQLELALERLRWVSDLPNEPLVMVNIPMFELTVWNSPYLPGPPVFRTGVIVGKALDTQTPIIVEEMRYLVFQPYWNVPPSIAANEILPALDRDPHYLVKNNMEIVEGQSDGESVVPATGGALDGVATGRLRIRQRPGPWNSLGPVKFMFPNAHNVYLHGTPAQQLFDRTRRDFSHGCVRVEDPTGLAEWVLREKPGWDRSRIEDAMLDGSRVSYHVSLPRPLTVVLFYSTAFVEEDGTVRFARDIYGHDRRLEAALGKLKG